MADEKEHRECDALWSLLGLILLILAAINFAAAILTK